uniref:Uncharacterized protein n=1 Tax=Arundo donax TaxID=35708 RepID=A0A0A8ZLT6_ARUDO
MQNTNGHEAEHLPDYDIPDEPEDLTTLVFLSYWSCMPEHIFVHVCILAVKKRETSFKQV